MAAQGSYGVTIKATDQTSAVIANINKQLYKLRDAGNQAQSGFKEITETNSKFTQSFESFSEAIKSTTLSFTDSIPIVGGLSRAFGTLGSKIVGPAGIATAFLIGAVAVLKTRYEISVFANKIELAARSTGLAVDQLQNLRKASELAGGSADDLLQTLKSVGQVRLAAETGTNNQAFIMQRAAGVKESDSDAEALEKELAFTEKMTPHYRDAWRANLGIQESPYTLKNTQERAKYRKDAGLSGNITPKQIEELEKARVEGIGGVIEQQQAFAKGITATLALTDATVKLTTEIGKLEEIEAGRGMGGTPGGSNPADPTSPGGFQGSPLGKWLDRFWTNPGGLGRSGPRADALSSSLDQTPALRAWGDMISGAEGADYNTRYGDRPGSGTLDTTGPHPGMVAGTNHSPAGRYQFTQATWHEGIAALGLPDVMSKANQDKVFAWDMAKHGVTEEMLKDPSRRQEVLSLLRGTEWASLPNGVQPRISMDKMNQDLDRYMKDESERATVGPRAFKAADAPKDGKDGTINVHITGTPLPGHTVTVRSTGEAFDAPATGMAMPLIGP